LWTKKMKNIQKWSRFSQCVEYQSKSSSVSLQFKREIIYFFFVWKITRNLKWKQQQQQQQQQQ
jgi:hypothetical protein